MTINDNYLKEYNSMEQKTITKKYTLNMCWFELMN